MKKFMISMGLIGLMAITAACGEESSGDEDPGTEESSGSEDAEAVETTGEEAETQEEAVTKELIEASEGETVENDAGTFTVEHKLDDVGTFEQGPITFNIDSVMAVSGELSEEEFSWTDLEDPNVEFVQVEMSAENSSEETLTFYPDQATITTNTGEQLESDMFLGDYMESEFIGQVNHQGNSVYLLNETNAADLESIRFLADPPSDEEYMTIEVDEEIDEEIEFN